VAQVVQPDPWHTGPGDETFEGVRERRRIQRTVPSGLLMSAGLGRPVRLVRRGPPRVAESCAGIVQAATGPAGRTPNGSDTSPGEGRESSAQ